MKRLLTLSAIPLTVVALAACGDNDHKRHVAANVAPPATTTMPKPARTAPAGQAQSLAIAADPSGQLKYTQNSLTAKAGKVTIDFTNKAPLPHDVVLIDSASYSPSAKVLGQTPIFQGGTKNFTVNLMAGKYYFYCSVPGHRQAGMFGTLTVTGSTGGAAKPGKAATKPAPSKAPAKPAPAKPAPAKPAPAKPAIAPAAASTVNVAADPSGQLKFDPSAASTKAGKVTIDFTNKAPLPHDIVLIDSASYSSSAKVLGQTPIFQGGTKSFTATLTAGKYYFYCSVPGHRQAGMFGTLTVS
jgi:uncharacterized cupredoxin-like copper-binding protein